MKFDNDASIAYGQDMQNYQLNGKLLDSLFEEFIGKDKYFLLFTKFIHYLTQFFVLI